jgi:hypothetical protein
MTKDVYKQRMVQIHKEASDKKEKLIMEYAMCINTHAKGDKITDHMGTIIIEKIRVKGGSSGYEIMPSCVYYGLELKKNGEPRKDKSRRDIYISNVLKNN